MIRVYKYGARAPILNADIVSEQLRLAHKYYCVLLRAIIDIKRNAERQIQRGAEVTAAEVAAVAAQATVDALNAGIKKQRKSTRSRSETADMREALKEARADLKSAKETLKVARSEATAAARDTRDRAHEKWLKERRRMRSESGLRHGTYAMVENAVDAANSKTQLWDKYDATLPKDPRFPRWDGTGHIGVQVQRGITVPLFFAGNDTRVQARLEPDLLQEKDKNSRGGGSRRPQFATLRLRVGSDEKRKPIWAEFPIRMHHKHQLPPDAVIKSIAVSVRKIGPYERWSTEITLDIPNVKEKCGHGTVALDLGWRAIADEFRMIAWVDEFGGRGELRLPAPIVASLRKASELQAVRSKNLDALKTDLLAYLPEEVPDWLRAKTATRKDTSIPSSAQARARLAKWKSQARFARLAKDWPGGCPQFLEEWRYHDFHLWEWEDSQRKQAEARRKDFYRNFAAWLTRTYDTVVLEDFKISKVARNANTEDAAENQHAKANRHLCAPGELRTTILHAASARDCVVGWVKPEYSTQECPYDDCRHVEKWDAAASITRKPECPKCGRTWDQDYGAARVLLRRWNTDPEQVVVKKEDTESKRERVQRQREEKLERMRAAQ